MLNAGYTKIKTTGEWGLRVYGHPAVGDVVNAVRNGDRFGTRKEVTEIVATYPDATICKFKAAPKKAKTPAPETPSFGNDCAKALDETASEHAAEDDGFVF